MKIVSGRQMNPTTLRFHFSVLANPYGDKRLLTRAQLFLMDKEIEHFCQSAGGVLAIRTNNIFFLFFCHIWQAGAPKRSICRRQPPPSPTASSSSPSDDPYFNLLNPIQSFDVNIMKNWKHYWGKCYIGGFDKIFRRRRQQRNMFFIMTGDVNPMEDNFGDEDITFTHWG